MAENFVVKVGDKVVKFPKGMTKDEVEAACRKISQTPITNSKAQKTGN
jgi:hypothetical protein